MTYPGGLPLTIWPCLRAGLPGYDAISTQVRRWTISLCSQPAGCRIEACHCLARLARFVGKAARPLHKYTYVHKSWQGKSCRFGDQDGPVAGMTRRPPAYRIVLGSGVPAQPKMAEQNQHRMASERPEKAENTESTEGIGGHKYKKANGISRKTYPACFTRRGSCRMRKSTFFVEN